MIPRSKVYSLGLIGGSVQDVCGSKMRRDWPAGSFEEIITVRPALRKRKLNCLNQFRSTSPILRSSRPGPDWFSKPTIMAATGSGRGQGAVPHPAPDPEGLKGFRHVVNAKKLNALLG